VSSFGCPYSRKQYYFWQRSTGKTTWKNPFEAAAAAAATSGDAGKDDKKEATTAASAESVKSGVQEAVASTEVGTTDTATATTQPPSDAPAGKGKGKGKGKEQGATSTQPPLPSQPPLPAQPPLPGQAPVASTSTSSLAGSGGHPQAAYARQHVVDYGGIDPELAFLDPHLAARASGGDAAFKARFNAKTGRFEGDPTRAPDRVGEFERSKRQNNFFFDYDNWAKAEALKQEQQVAKRSAEEAVLGTGTGTSDSYHKRPSKKEMEAIRARQKEKKEKRQKGWLMSG